MNKKALLLLPFAALFAVTGCKNNKAADDEEEVEVCPALDNRIYGTEDSPLTVSQLITNVSANVKAEDGKFSCYKFYVSGVSDATYGYDGGSSSYKNLFLKDSLTSRQSFKVLNAITTLSLNNTICVGDRVLLSGYVEYYSGGYSFYPNGNDQPEIISCQRATSTFSIENNASSYITVTSSHQTQYSNMTEVTVTATNSRANYAIVASVNGAVINASSENTYKFYIKGNTVLSLDLEWAGDRQNVAAGTYTLKLTNANSKLPSEVGKSATNVKYSLVPDDPDHDTFYKQVSATWTKEVINYNMYDEITFNSGGKVTFNLPQGVVSKVEICTFRYRNIMACKGTNIVASKELATRKEIDPPSEFEERQEPHLFVYENYTTDGVNQISIGATESKSISIHYIQLTITIA